MHRVFRLILTTALAAAAASAGLAQAAYPERPVRLIVPFAPGGASDFVARIIDSSAIAPDPPKRSRMCNPSKLPNSDVREEKSPSRARSEVGRVAPATAPKVRPRATPAIILNLLTLI